MEAEIHEASEFPSLETWFFEVRLMGDRTPNSPKTATAIRNAVIVDLAGDDVSEPKPPREQGWQRANLIRSEIENLVATRLSAPETIYYVIDYKESEGSFVISFGVLAAVYHGVSHYGEFRKGLDRIVDDLRLLFAGVSGVVARVNKRFKARQQLPRKRIEPRINWNEIKDDESNSKDRTNS
jgi:hypothetical protein